MTDKQQAFIEHYCTDADYNASKAYRMAGYNPKDSDAHAARLRVNGSIKEAIDKKMAEIKDVSVATREQRQQFWSETYRDDNVDMNSRLRASELLGKSEADFTENYAAKTGKEPKPLTDEELEEWQAIAIEFMRRKSIRLHKASEGAQEAAG